MNDLNSPSILTHFQEADRTCIAWARYDVLKFPNYHNCSKIINVGFYDITGKL